MNTVVTGFEELGVPSSIEEDGLGWLCTFSNSSQSVRIVNPKRRPWETWWQSFTVRMLAFNHAAPAAHRSVVAFGVLTPEQTAELGLHGGPFPYLVARTIPHVEFPKKLDNGVNGCLPLCTGWSSFVMSTVRVRFTVV